MPDSFSSLHLDCSPFVETNKCLFARLSTEQTLDDVGEQICSGCGARVNDIERRVAGALAQVTVDRYDGETALSRAMEGLGTFSDAMMTPDETFRIGTQVGDYVLEKLIGRGSMGTVYQARPVDGSEQRFAVKLLEHPATTNSRNVKRFKREFDALCGIRHTNIVHAMSSGSTDDCQFFVMELLEGVDVGQLVSQFAKLPVATACEIVRQAAMGIHRLHRNGLLHRDIKPSNLMLLPARTVSDTAQMTVKVLDLGLIKTIDPNDESMQLTPDGATMGTYAYMSPEQLNDPRDIGVQSDVYGLGAVLWRMIMGEQYMPAVGRTEQADHPEGLIEILRQAIHSDASQRFQSAGEFAEALEPFARNANCDSIMAAFRVVSAE